MRPASVMSLPRRRQRPRPCTRSRLGLDPAQSRVIAHVDEKRTHASNAACCRACIFRAASNYRSAAMAQSIYFRTCWWPAPPTGAPMMPPHAQPAAAGLVGLPRALAAPLHMHISGHRGGGAINTSALRPALALIPQLQLCAPRTAQRWHSENARIARERESGRVQYLNARSPTFSLSTSTSLQLIGGVPLP
jgi:hypothetical protein